MYVESEDDHMTILIQRCLDCFACYRIFHNLVCGTPGWTHSRYIRMLSNDAVKLSLHQKVADHICENDDFMKSGAHLDLDNINTTDRLLLKFHVDVGTDRDSNSIGIKAELKQSSS